MICLAAQALLLMEALAARKQLPQAVLAELVLAERREEPPATREAVQGAEVQAELGEAQAVVETRQDVLAARRLMMAMLAESQKYLLAP